MLDKYFKNECTHKELINSISTAIQALEYYKVFGHTGVFDTLFETDFKIYMLAYPQIYFKKTYDTEFPEHIKDDSKYYSSFKSKIYTEQFKPESFHELMKFPNFMCNKIFINKDGNFTVRSNNFQYVTNSNGVLYIPSKETLEKLGKQNESK